MTIEVVTCKLVGNAIIEAMEQAGLTQEETAARTGLMSSRQLNRIIKGQHCPSLERAWALSIVLGIPIEKLFQLKVSTRKAA